MADPKLIEAMAAALEQCDEDALGLHNLSPKAQEPFLHRARAALSAISEAGWQCVPKEPTKEMALAGAAALDDCVDEGYDSRAEVPYTTIRDGTQSVIYRAMLAASEQ